MKKHKHLILPLAAMLLLSVLCLGRKTVYLPVRTEVYNYTDDHPEGQLSNTTRYYYNAFSHPTMLIYQNSFGRYTLDVECDFRGNVLSCDGNYQVSDDLLSGTHISNTYTWNGKLLNSNPDYTTSYERTYDFTGKITAIKRTRGQNQEYTVITRFTHNAFGKPLTAHHYRVNGETEQLYEYTEFSYNWIGKLKKEVRYDANGTPIRFFDYLYKDGKTVVNMALGSTPDKYQTTLIFDHAGNLVEQTYHSSQNKTTYVYTYRPMQVPFFISKNTFVYHKSFPEFGLGEWYDFWNY